MLEIFCKLVQVNHYLLQHLFGLTAASGVTNTAKFGIKNLIDDGDRFGL
jgi:hypothetical protein